jgi:hypothetical protein
MTARFSGHTEKLSLVVALQKRAVIVRPDNLRLSPCFNNSVPRRKTNERTNTVVFRCVA